MQISVRSIMVQATLGMPNLVDHTVLTECFIYSCTENCKVIHVLWPFIHVEQLCKLVENSSLKADMDLQL